jgi:hypothetical protein
LVENSTAVGDLFEDRRPPGRVSPQFVRPMPRRPRIRNAFELLKAKPDPSVVATMKTTLARETVAKANDLP